MTRATALIQACISGAPFTMKERKQMKQFNKILVLSACAVFLFACGGGKDHDSDDSDVTDAGTDAAQPEPHESTPLTNIDNYAPGNIALSYQLLGGGGISHVISLFIENGWRWFAVTGDCRYWAFSEILSNSVGHNPWADVVTGQLSKDECEALVADTHIGKKCDSYSENWIGASTKIVSNGIETMTCYPGSCQSAGADAHALALEARADTAFQIFLDRGTPVDGKLRGYLRTASTSSPGIAQDAFNDFPDENALPLPAGMEDYAIDFYANPEPLSIIFPDEFQDALKALRKSVQDGTVVLYREGIPVQDADGGKYVLYLRQVTGIEDPGTGIISFPNACL